MSNHLELLYQNLLNGKLPHNLSWSEAVELVEHLGEVNRTETTNLCSASATNAPFSGSPIPMISV
jgi:hypothetical protein